MSIVAKTGGANVSGGEVPRVLVVDDESSTRELLTDVVRSMDCDVLFAGSIAEARRIISRENLHVVLADVNLPDGDGTALLSLLKKRSPTASGIVMTGAPSVSAATLALREGAVDFISKPFNVTQIQGHIRSAIDAQILADRGERKLRKLKSAVRKLNDARKTITQKVDILCNDLVSAYGELSKQIDLVRVQEGFRKTIATAKDLEQLICQSMDWLMRQTGFANVAVWLVGEEGDYQLGAYMKYTIPGDDRVSEALRRAILPLTAREGRDTPVRLTSAEVKEHFSPKNQHLFKDQEFLAIDCTYLGESLAALIFFRDEQVPFGEQDIETLKSVGPIFASALAAIVRLDDHDDSDDHGYDGDGGRGDHEPTGPDSQRNDNETGGMADPKRRKTNKPDPADWWKRGETPPF